LLWFATAVALGAALGPDAGTSKPALQGDLELPGPHVTIDVDPSVVQDVIRSHRPEIVPCYLRERAGSQELAGKVAVRFTITPTGRVREPTITTDELESKTLELCLQHAIERWEFPYPPTDLIVQYDWVFPRDARDLGGVDAGPDESSLEPHGLGGLGLRGKAAVVTGALPKETIALIIREHEYQVQACYEGELGRHPDLKGKVTVTFTISREGDVAEARVRETTLHSPQVEGCIVKHVLRWKFAKPLGGGQVIVTYPWVFQTAPEAPDAGTARFEI
jgi:hypothetical protein